MNNNLTALLCKEPDTEIISVLHTGAYSSVDEVKEIYGSLAPGSELKLVKVNEQDMGKLEADREFVEKLFNGGG